ncbi:hypothetical protein AL013_02490 [Mariprofundus ferrooxydans]|nr:hypothetical protein AL013_02490 [Mariprofundus ferrooxydans]
MGAMYLLSLLISGTLIFVGGSFYLGHVVRDSSKILLPDFFLQFPALSSLLMLFSIVLFIRYWYRRNSVDTSAKKQLFRSVLLLAYMIMAIGFLDDDFVRKIFSFLAKPENGGVQFPIAMLLVTVVIYIIWRQLTGNWQIISKTLMRRVFFFIPLLYCSYYLIREMYYGDSFYMLLTTLLVIAITISTKQLFRGVVFIITPLLYGAYYLFRSAAPDAYFWGDTISLMSTTLLVIAIFWLTKCSWDYISGNWKVKYNSKVKNFLQVFAVTCAMAYCVLVYYSENDYGYEPIQYLSVDGVNRLMERNKEKFASNILYFEGFSEAGGDEYAFVPVWNGLEDYYEYKTVSSRTAKVYELFHGQMTFKARGLIRTAQRDLANKSCKALMGITERTRRYNQSKLDNCRNSALNSEALKPLSKLIDEYGT